MNLASVKKIVIPEGSVKKITNTANGTLWADPSKYLYRQLDYIKFNGAEVVPSGLALPSNNTDCFVVDMYSTGVNGTLLGNYYSYEGAEMYYFHNGGFTFTQGGGNYDNTKTSASYTTSDYFPNNARRKAVFRPGTLALINVYNGSTRIGADEFTQSKFVPGSRTLIFGANNGSSANDYLSNCRIYGISQNNCTVSSGSKINIGTAVHNWVPCQRKSDNVCGLFDTVDKVFRPMQGTTITNNARGNIVNEYPDALSV